MKIRIRLLKKKMFRVKREKNTTRRRVLYATSSYIYKIIRMYCIYVVAVSLFKFQIFKFSIRSPARRDDVDPIIQVCRARNKCIVCVRRVFECRLGQKIKGQRAYGDCSIRSGNDIPITNASWFFVGERSARRVGFRTRAFAENIF